MIDDPGYYIREGRCAAPYVLPVLAYAAGAVVVVVALGVMAWRQIARRIA